MYYYKIMMRQLKSAEYTGQNCEYVILNSNEVELLRTILNNPKCRYKTDFLKLITDKHARGELDNYECLHLYTAIIEYRFKTNKELERYEYYVHVLPTAQGYLNFRLEDMQPFLDDTTEGWYKTKFTKTEIEELKQDPRFKGIDFDNCLEEVPKA